MPDPQAPTVAKRFGMEIRVLVSGGVNAMGRKAQVMMCRAPSPKP